MEQDLSKLDVTKLHPLSPEVISRQATINIGTDTILFLAIFRCLQYEKNLYGIRQYRPCGLLLIS
jgi:hypothetical protein